MYIKVSVTPISDGNINNQGEIAWSDTYIGPVYGTIQIEAAIRDIDEASSDDVLGKLELYNEILGIDLSFAGFSEEEKDNALAIFADTTLSNTPERVSKTFYLSQAIAKLNFADAQTITQMLEEDIYELDLTLYSQLEDKSYVGNALYDKNFTKLSEIEGIFYPAVALCAVNHAGISEMKTVLNKIDEFLDEDISQLDSQTLNALGSMMVGEYEELEQLDTAISVNLEKIAQYFENEEMLNLSLAG